MSEPQFDIDLMASTAHRMIESITGDLHSIEKSHGIDFANSVASNIGTELLAFVIASYEDPAARAHVTLNIVTALQHNIRIHSAENVANDTIAKAMRGFQ